MAEQAGEKSEQPTARRLEDAIKKGQFPRSAEVQTVMVLGGALMALKFTGPELWQRFIGAQYAILGHLHDIPISMDAMQGYAMQGAAVLTVCAAPVALATMVGGTVAGGIQSRFQTASEALDANWERLNPVEGFKKLVSPRAAVTTLISLVKLAVIGGLTYSEAKQILSDPIFFSAVDAARIAEFLAGAAESLVWRVGLALTALAAADYGYQFWQTHRDLMMTKEEVKEELKNSEGDPHVKARQRRRRSFKTQRQMLAEVPKADVVVTNPTHLAVALRYDRKTMKAPRIVAKGSRLNAMRIREIAARHQVPIVENKPLARMMFKYGRVGGEIPAQLYAAVAEVLAWVYRVNRYRYYAEQNNVK